MVGLSAVEGPYVVQKPSSACRCGRINRGWEILGPPPRRRPASISRRMLNILEGLRLSPEMAFGTAETIHLLAPKCSRSPLPDRAAASGDPDFVNVPGGGG